MSMTETQKERMGQALYEALKSGKTIQPLTIEFPKIEIDDAYYISQYMLKERVADTGTEVVGKKIGVTSAAVQEMLGVYQPDFGFLTADMVREDGANVQISGNLIQPRAEAEIAFILEQDLRGPGITEDDVLAATKYVAPCFEIVDSRIEDWRIRIQDTIADNASCGVYVLGDAKVDPKTLDLPRLEVMVYKNGELISQGVGSAVQGNPLTAVAWLANTLSQFDIPFKAGETILSGSLVPLEPVASGDEMFMELSDVGTASITFS